MKKVLMSLVILSVLLLAVFSVQALSTDTQNVGVKAQRMGLADKPKRTSLRTELSEQEISELKADMPDNVEAVEAQLEEVDIQPNRYLLWTNDGVHIMWGKFANGYFIGEDNEGNKAWGIYQNGIWAGFYDGDQFFYGKYSRGRWVAHGLFGMRTSSGRFITFPRLRTMTRNSFE